MDIALLIGITGSTLLLIGFFLNLFKWISQESYAYILLNAAGSGAMIAYAILLGSTPFLILNIVWTFFAVYKLVRKILKKK